MPLVLTWLRQGRHYCFAEQLSAKALVGGLFLGGGGCCFALEAGLTGLDTTLLAPDK